MLTFLWFVIEVLIDMRNLLYTIYKRYTQLPDELVDYLTNAVYPLVSPHEQLGD